MATLLSLIEAADLIKRSPAAVRNLVMRRSIPYRKPGGRLLFVKEELMEWVMRSEGISVDEIEK